MARLLIGNIKGPKGDKGDTGATGPQGKQGAQGVQGAKGDVGLPALVMKKSLVGEYPVGSTFTGNVSEWLNRTPLANEYSTALSGGGKYSIVGSAFHSPAAYSRERRFPVNPSSERKALPDRKVQKVTSARKA